MSQRTWFITGTSRGFGRIWAAAALDRGDRVVGTARDVGAVSDLQQRYPDTFLGLPLDVTDRPAVFGAVKTAHAHFGKLDIIVNNAGYGQFGMVEELSEQEARDQIDTNLFGALWVTQAALPYLREARKGHILQVSSIGGITAFPGIGIYHASKWALEGLSQSLASEVASFGVHLTLIEPQSYATDWAGASAKRATVIDAYGPVREATYKRLSSNKPGDPDASAAAVLNIVDAETPPLRAFLGSAPLAVAESEYASRLKMWREWQPVAELAQGS
ncbi:NADP-dependent 3-hydroxy acid dehydrogenase YdfG [Actinacidiphila yanglinensis]|uniref:NADP-dependent 3-hydroxy acid dehydrogenase YdfG n=1 Tax=Actinacidiphila yanglinensis TaxID=310779 RepID=A0A1H6ED46_9ACTN|nr:SDR family oxidoreductase [Actinacidiphila yanglinensis]SEG94876.1 NADP-dependent 3-hydroxy acid dehydrogenase YdfG [Actinacidiphila yanglinensis]